MSGAEVFEVWTDYVYCSDDTMIINGYLIAMILCKNFLLCIFSITLRAWTIIICDIVPSEECNFVLLYIKL